MRPFIFTLCLFPAVLAQPLNDRLKDATKAVEADPKSIPALVDRAEIYEQLGKFTEAIGEMFECIVPLAFATHLPS